MHRNPVTDPETCGISLYVFVYAFVNTQMPNVCTCHRQTHFTISPIAAKVFSAFKTEVQELFSHHPQLITCALVVFLSVPLPLSLIHMHSWWRIIWADTHFTPTQTELSWNELNHTEGNTLCLSLPLAIWTCLMDPMYLKDHSDV